jgi:plastocyanin
MKAAIYFFLPVSIVSTIIAVQVFKTRAVTISALHAAAMVSAPATQSAVSVKIDNFVFQPKELVIPAGTTVTWQNADDVPHTATSKDDPQTFDSGALDTDDKFSFTFNKPGKYPYYCKVHTHMTGVVIVK